MDEALQGNPWKFSFYFNETQKLSFTSNVAFRYKIRSANFMEDALARHWVERVSLGGCYYAIGFWVGYIVVFPYCFSALLPSLLDP